ncbi:transmembrane protein, putative (macronuclear) [Tetrahymena thermophila SB210]|uniref:Transmembrane protein, putative n=1 Tax=Tetrahymena thermophila (strain SB210) TaxID=312017 RepID=W7XLN3_TETTS|nr:transmembrane protein, putative [Tetrahymena thermophila SB210]EWS76589.1 transmembrane protein, putative [Tetrahymena thermophila SB210]|eukprot:XP_012650875.1 transmembrane protein, putative [Tetrahymena thermophila SB210]
MNARNLFQEQRIQSETKSLWKIQSLYIDLSWNIQKSKSVLFYSKYFEIIKEMGNQTKNISTKKLSIFQLYQIIDVSEMMINYKLKKKETILISQILNIFIFIYATH